MTWTKHGESAQAALLAGVLPLKGIHFLAGPDKSGRTSVAVDMAVAIAAGDVGVALFKMGQQTGHTSDAMLARYVRDGELFTQNAAGALL